MPSRAPSLLMSPVLFLKASVVRWEHGPSPSGPSSSSSPVLTHLPGSSTRAGSPCSPDTNPVISPLLQCLPLDLSRLPFPFHQPWAPPVVYLRVYLLLWVGSLPRDQYLGGHGGPPAPEPTLLLGSPGQYFLLSFCLATFGFSLGFCLGVVVFLVLPMHP